VRCLQVVYEAFKELGFAAGPRAGGFGSIWQ
jgi:hypothetical protein